MFNDTSYNFNMIPAKSFYNPGLPLMSKHCLTSGQHINLDIIPNVSSLEPESIIIRISPILTKVPNLKIHFLKIESYYDIGFKPAKEPELHVSDHFYHKYIQVPGMKKYQVGTQHQGNPLFHLHKWSCVDSICALVSNLCCFHEYGLSLHLP